MNPAPIEFRDPDRIVTSIELLTDLYGGGASPDGLRNETWLRPPAVRGALRFWWRALFAAEFESIETLRRREFELFGGLGPHGATTSPVRVSVRGAKRATANSVTPKAEQRFLYPRSWANPGSTPLLEARDRSAELELTFATCALDHALPDWRDQIRRAAAAWVLLGGAGGRTRRGVGAIGFTDRAAADTLGAPWGERNVTTWLQGLPRGGSELEGAVFSLRDCSDVWISKPAAEPELAHARLIRLWNRFRQPGQGGQPPTEFRWQESADLKAHRPKVKSPRVHLGLPLSIQPGGPGKTTFSVNKRGGGSPRYASPVLLSVVRTDANDFRGVVVVTRSHVTSGSPDLEFERRTPIEPGSFSDVVDRLRECLASDFGEIVRDGRPVER